MKKNLDKDKTNTSCGQCGKFYTSIEIKKGHECKKIKRLKSKLKKLKNRCTVTLLKGFQCELPKGHKGAHSSHGWWRYYENKN